MVRDGYAVQGALNRERCMPLHVLFVTRFLPHAGAYDSGGQDNYHYIKELLARDCEVSLVSYARPSDARGLREMESLCKDVVAIPYSDRALLPRARRAWWRLLRTRVYGRVYSRRYAEALRELLNRRSFDVAIVEGAMAWYGRLLRNCPKVLDEVDVFGSVAYQDYRNAPSGGGRWFLWADWLRTWHMELSFVRAYDGILVRSKKDRAILQEYVPEALMLELPPWFEGLEDLRSVPSSRPGGANLLFVGAMANPSNVAAVCYFADAIFPRIVAEVPDAVFQVVGNAPTAEVRRLGERASIVVTGAVEDLRPYYRDCVVNVVPLLTGGGIIVKTLNGLAAARPTVTTSLGNSGTGAIPDREVLVADCASDFADCVVRLLRDVALWHRLASAGRAFVDSHFDWPAAMDRLADFLRLVAD